MLIPDEPGPQNWTVRTGLNTEKTAFFCGCTALFESEDRFSQNVAHLLSDSMMTEKTPTVAGKQVQYL